MSVENPKVVDEHRLLIPLIDQVARQTPDQLFAKFPRHKEGFQNGAIDVTVSDLARAINRTSYWLEEHLGRPQSVTTLAYIGPNDIRYFIVAGACIKTGYKLMLPSPRNSISNHIHLLDSTECKTILKSVEVHVDNILAVRDISVIDVPDLFTLLSEAETPEYPYNKSFNEAAFDSVMVMHSSGSTGQVKPIHWNNAFITTLDAHRILLGKQAMFQAVPQGSLTLSLMPPFHSAGFITQFFRTIFSNRPIVLPAVGASISADIVADAIHNVDGIVALESAPSILEDMALSPDNLKVLDQLEYATYMGGPLSPDAAKVVAKHIKIQSWIGSTEAGTYPELALEDYTTDYEYQRFAELPGIEFRSQGEGFYELVLVRENLPIKWSGLFYTMPDIDEYPTKDLYSKHPTKKGYWRHEGRVDDLIVLSNGEKVSPGAMEHILHEAPDVHEVIILGQGRFEVAALIELEKRAQQDNPKDAMERIMPFIKRANSQAPNHAQLSKDRVMFTVPEKPMLRTPKMTVARRATLTAYELELDGLYAGDASSETTSLPLFDSNDASATEQALSDIITKVTNVPNLAADRDFFNAGMDSLKVLTLVRHIRAKVTAEISREAAATVSSSLIYSNPTLKDLSCALQKKVATDIAEKQPESNFDELESMFQKYSKDFLRLKAGKSTTIKATDKETTHIILTGSTGSLGSYILDSLLSHPGISKITCLNRSQDSQTRQTNTSGSKSLRTDWGTKVNFLSANLADENLGLSQSDYDTLIAETTYIIHNQWAVDFNKSLPTFEPHVRGVKNLITLSAQSANSPPILFTSSISATGNWSRSHPAQPIPEQFIDDPRVILPMGYGQSKWLGEKLLARAAEGAGVSAAVCRLGQIAGPVRKHGMWNKQEWLPTLIASSKHLGVLPDSLGAQEEVDWIPVDILADAIVDVVDATTTTATTTTANEPAAEPWTRFFNAVNPTLSPWKSLVPSVLSALHPAPRVVSYDEWLQAVQTSAAAQDVDPVANPAVKLLEFFEGLGAGNTRNKFVTRGLVAVSGNMQGVGGVSGVWMEGWMRQWGF